MTTTTEYEVVIGLETHVQLKTRSKMFCSCERDYFDTEPNTHACPVCLAMPGMLPVINSQAVSFTILTGLALGCEIPLHSKFDRKNYPYPDLLKGYQISQFDQPLCLGGGLDIEVDGVASFVHLERIHLEEDTARLLHRDGGGGEAYSLLDVNRAGVPLMEIVTQPDMHSSAQALTYLRKLRQLLRYLGVSDADMEKGSFRCDANISLRPHGQQELGAKVEVKNMNSFRAIQRALETEIVRQSAMLDAGETIAQETRGYIDATGDTVSQRSKEQAHDYRYVPEPDLPPLLTEPAVVDELRAQLPELPEARRERFEQQYALGEEEARVLTETRARADTFEATVEQSTPQRSGPVARWLIGDVAALLNQLGADAELAATKLTPGHVAELVDLVEDGAITAASAKQVLQLAFESGEMPSAIVEARGLGRVDDGDALDGVAAAVIEANPKAVEDYRGGKESAIKFLVGQVMRETRGTSDPNSAAETLRRLLDAG
ncbi:MAG: Asp-tRNA(Asn)/Glu-tRNA(Gln) amidotransferase subunit GatB [Dehalococcoidia bacterium]